MNDLADFAGRVLIAALFLAGALQKAADPGPVTGLLARIALIAGVAVGPVARSLAGYCVVTSYFHWLPSDPWQITVFIKSWTIAGGCLVLPLARRAG